MDMDTHRQHAKHFVRYYSRLLADRPDDKDWLRGLEYALEYQAIVEQEPLDMGRAQKLADALDNFKGSGSAALDMYLHVGGLLGKRASRTRG